MDCFIMQPKNIMTHVKVFHKLYAYTPSFQILTLLYNKKYPRSVYSCSSSIHQFGKKNQITTKIVTQNKSELCIYPLKLTNKKKNTKNIKHKAYKLYSVLYIVSKQNKQTYIQILEYQMCSYPQEASTKKKTLTIF